MLSREQVEALRKQTAARVAKASKSGGAVPQASRKPAKKSYYRPQQSIHAGTINCPHCGAKHQDRGQPCDQCSSYIS